MFWFTLRFAIWSFLLLALIYFENYSPFYFITELQTSATVYATQLWIEFFHIPVTLTGNTMRFSHGLELMILNECNGLTPFILYLAAILAFPTRYRAKINRFFGGMVLLLTLNFIRIILITLYVIDYPEGFECAHNIVGRYSIGTITLYLFYLFTTHVKTCTPYGIIFNGKSSHLKRTLKT